MKIMAYSTGIDRNTLIKLNRLSLIPDFYTGQFLYNHRSLPHIPMVLLSIVTTVILFLLPDALSNRNVQDDIEFPNFKGGPLTYLAFIGIYSNEP